MKTIFATMTLSLILAATSRAEDAIIVSEVRGGPPLVAANKKNVAPLKKVVVEVKGQRFAKIKKDVVAALAFLGNDRTWWDVGPDASFMSAEITVGTNKYTLNSWFPLERTNPRIAVSETRGLVPASGMKEKEGIEGQNSMKYKALVAVFEKAMNTNPEPQGGRYTPSTARASKPIP